ncbi:hypothetical protein ABW19_dt0201375 [Dactylella cylindrospora]|nr:hypothetical protein ABW19_dt0201375 [Dactylella cylindrospora]
MNAQSYLQSFGWTPGTSLGNPLSHLPSSSTGGSNPRLTKRILTSTKNNTHGVGRKASNLNHSDLWWEKAFDVSLKKLDVTKDTTSIKKEEKEVVDNMNLFAELGGGRGFGGTKINGGGKSAKGVEGVNVTAGGLYRYFVRGDGLEGTIKPISSATSPSADTAEEADRPSKKRKLSSSSTGDPLLSKSDRKAEKTAKAVAKLERKRLRAERRAAKLERRRLREERRVTKDEKRQRKAERKASKLKEKEEVGQEPAGVQSDSGVELSRDATPVIEDLPSKPEKAKKLKEKNKDKSSKADKSKDQSREKKKKKKTSS